MKANLKFTLMARVEYLGVGVAKAEPAYRHCRTPTPLHVHTDSCLILYVWSERLFACTCQSSDCAGWSWGGRFQQEMSYNVIMMRLWVVWAVLEICVMGCIHVRIRRSLLSLENPSVWPTGWNLPTYMLTGKCWPHFTCQHKQNSID